MEIIVVILTYIGNTKGVLVMAKKVLTPAEVEIKMIKKQYRKEKMRSIGTIALAVAFSAIAIGKTAAADKVGSDNVIVENNNNNNNSSTNNNTQTQSPSDGVDMTPDKDLSNDPANWSKEQIVNFYKQSAAKTHPTAQSSQKMELTRMVVNNGGGLIGGFISLVKPVIDSVVAKQELTFEGVTGGFDKLVASDVASAKAYKEGNYTVIEMTMVEQTDGLYGDPQEGTVGHAISVLGNVATAVAEFPDFNIAYEDADIKIHYANPTVKVKINENGVIEKGTWKYDTQIDIKHLQIESVMVDTADAEIIYTITVGGGF